jgi:hypothetical protein
MLAGAYSVVQSWSSSGGAEPGIVPPSIALSTAFTAAYLVLLGVIAERMVRSKRILDAQCLSAEGSAAGGHDG